jgi:hypothetical protein
MESLRAGTQLFRIYGDPYRPIQFNPTPRQGLGGARFDCTPEETFGVLYLGSSDACAVAETLLRDAYGGAPHQIPQDTLAKRKLCCVAPSRDLALVKLHGNGLYGVAPARQWLTTCVPRYYDATRGWGRAIRAWALEADGFVWRSRHLNDQFAYVLFEDRCIENDLKVLPHPFAAALGSGHIDRQPGLSYLRVVLKSFQAVVGR